MMSALYPVWLFFSAFFLYFAYVHWRQSSQDIRHFTIRNRDPEKQEQGPAAELSEANLEFAQDFNRYLDTVNQNYDVDGTLVYKNLLRKASFEQADSLGPPYWQRLNPSGGTTNWARYSNGTAKSGAYFLQANSNPAGGSIYQDVAIAPAVDESHTFVIWLRCNSDCTATNPLNGSVVLWGLGNPNDGTATSFSLTERTFWMPVYASLDVDTAGHTSMRAQVYINTAQRNLDLDAGGNSVSFCHQFC